jgi:phosphoribosyl-dephospho-CoA transferase
VFKDKVKRLGGVINNACCVDWPETLRIKTKQDAIDIIDVMRSEVRNGPEYIVETSVPLKELKRAIKKGLV